MLLQPLILGVLLFQVLFSMVQWFHSRRKEFLYYASYAVILTAYFFIRHQMVDHEWQVGQWRFNENFINRQLVYFAFFVYVGFGRWFADSGTRMPEIDKKVVVAQKVMLGYILLRLVWGVFSKDNILQEVAHVAFSTTSFVFFAYILYKVYYSGYPFTRFLVIGSILLASGAFIALLARVSGELGSAAVKDPLVFLEIGVILDLIFINTGLLYKSRFLLEEKKNIFRNSTPVHRASDPLESIRSEISDELQLELGRGLSEIKQMSDLVQQRTSREHSIELQRISENSARLIRSMNEIVWALDRQNDQLEKMLDYLAAYAYEICQQVNIGCTTTLPPSCPEVQITSDTRRHLFMAFKEALHNIIKHANATEVNIQFAVTADLSIYIRDNGKGIHLSEKMSDTGNGLKNMKRRMTLLSGTFNITTETGTTVVLTMPVARN